MGRRPCCEKVGLKRGRWSEEEDDRLMKYIQANGEGCWRSLPKNAGLLRCGKSCRLRWINYLRSDLKRGNITSEEEDIIIKLHATIGNKWSLIASHLPGRTDNEIKNYWNSHLSRKIHTFRRRTNNEATPIIINVAKLNLPPRRKGRRKGSSPPKVLKEKTELTVEKGNEIVLPPPTPPVERVSSEVGVRMGMRTETGISENENIKLEEEKRHEGGVKSSSEKVYECEESLDLEWFLAWDENKNVGMGTEEGEIGNLAHCDSLNSSCLDSTDAFWEWENIDDWEIKMMPEISEIEAVDSQQYHDALVTWLLS